MEFADGLYCCRVRMYRHEEMNLPRFKQDHQPQFAMIEVEVALTEMRLAQGVSRLFAFGVFGLALAAPSAPRFR